MKIKEIQKITTLTSMTVSTIISKAALGKIKLDPEEQRYAQWPAQYSMDLIDTMRAGLPVPSITAVYDKNGVYTIIDGRQRLTTILIMALGKTFKSLPHTGYEQKMSRETIDHLLEEMTNNELLFSGFEKLDQEQIINYRIPFTIVDLSNEDPKLFAAIKSILFDRLNRNSATMSNVNIYLSGLQQLLFDKGNEFKKVKNDLLPKINELLGIKNNKKTYEMGSIVDIRSMQLLVDKYDLKDPGHSSLRYSKAFKEIENGYIAKPKNKGEETKYKAAAEVEFNLLLKILEELTKELEKNKEKIGILTNETQRKAVIWLILKGTLNDNLPKAITMATHLKSIQSKRSYKEWQSKAGRTSPERLYHFLKIIVSGKDEENIDSDINQEATIAVTSNLKESPDENK